MASRSTSPAEPSKKRPPFILPNAHPYAIKTTSSALLSRSNSSPHSAHHTKHHYIPSPPSRIPVGARVRHRHSSSLSSVEGEVNRVRAVPAPLPTPPPNDVASSSNSSVSLKHADEPSLSPRVEAMPGSASEPIGEHHSDDQECEFSHDQGLYAGLPSNPKEWSTDHLTTYLETSFKLSNPNGDDELGLAGILEYVRTRGLTGRELLRLTDEDLAGTLLSDAQRAQLLERSRTLRADVLRGRIYVDSYHSQEVSDSSNDIYSQSVRSPALLYSVRGASVSVDDLRLLADNSIGEGESIFTPSPVVSLHRSNSVSDATAQRYRDLARMRMRRRGRVKGLVETWERASTSDSEYFASEAESESETDPESESISETKGSSEPPSDSLPTQPDEPTYTPCAPVVDATILPHESLPYTHMHNRLEATRIEEEEPSIEELLASFSNVPLTGARAWEADFGLGETVKHIPVSASADAENTNPSPLVTEPVAFRRQKDDGERAKSDSASSKGSGRRRGTGSRGKSAKTRMRVATAIFTGSPSPDDDVSENAGDQVQSRDHQHHGLDGVVCGQDLHNDPDTLRTLQESIAVTRAQLEAFRLRLEKVETDTARQEAMLMRANFSGSFCSSDFGLRQQPSEAIEQANVKATEGSGDEAQANGAKSRVMAENWEAMSLTDIARTIVANTIGWLFPYGHLGVYAPEDYNQQPCTGSHPGANDEYRPPAKRGGRLQVARASCSVILVSFAICAAVLRRVGLGKWIRRP